MNDKPGRELPKDYRAVANDLVNNQGWRYSIGKRHAMLYPPDRAKGQVTVPTTPTSDPRAFKNFISNVRQCGGEWPPKKGTG